MKILVISLVGAENRRQRISDQLNQLGLSFEFIDAIRGTVDMYQEPEYQREWRHKYWGNDLTPGEIGCYKSHQLACRRGVELKSPVLILEDDLLIHPELKDFLDKLETEIYLHKFDILRISGLFPKPTYTIKSGDFNFIRYFKPPLGAQGYVIKPEGAKRFLKYAEKIFIPIDDALDNDFNHKLIIYGYQPYLVEHDWGMGSDVGHRGKIKVSFRVKCCKQALRTWWSIKRLIFTWKNYFIDRFIFKRVV